MKPLMLFLTLVSCLRIAQADVPWGYRSVAEDYGIPPEILYSVALKESEAPGLGRPWPWTANVAGRGYYFDSRASLYAFLQSLIEVGRKSFDIGPGQVNWYWNGSRFASLWDATDPYVNLRVAASLLREHYRETQSWALAVGRYHSPGDFRKASTYIAGVGRKLARVLDQ